MTLVNTTGQIITITDVKIGGTSIMPIARAEMMASGRLEDADDAVTVLPNEALVVVCAKPKTGTDVSR